MPGTVDALRSRWRTYASPAAKLNARTRIDALAAIRSTRHFDVIPPISLMLGRFKGCNGGRIRKTRAHRGLPGRARGVRSALVRQPPLLRYRHSGHGAGFYTTEAVCGAIDARELNRFFKLRNGFSMA